jgi:hypothetical protein
MVVHALLKEREMKQLQVVVADAGSTSAGERIQLDQRPTWVPLGYTLSPEELDKVHGGTIMSFLADVWAAVLEGSRDAANWDIDVLLKPVE